jgi:hypothetical protein
MTKYRIMRKLPGKEPTIYCVLQSVTQMRADNIADALGLTFKGSFAAEELVSQGAELPG